MSQIAIVSPGYPTATGGVVDHTERLKGHWSSAGHDVTVLGAIDGPVDEVVDGWADRRLDAVLIQYVPFLYGLRGLSRMPARLAGKCREAGIRVSLFVHEPWVPATRLPWRVLSPLQRRQLLRLVDEADAVVTAVPGWASELGPKSQVISVGSTLGYLPSDWTEAEPLSSPLVFSPFAAGLAWDWIVEAVETLDAGLTVVGTKRDTALAHLVVRHWMSSAWDYRGRLPAAQVLELLSRARLVLAPFVDGLTGRRTSAMAALSVGSRLLSSTGPLFDPFFAGGPMGIAASASEYSRLARATWDTPDTAEQRARRIEWYGEHLDPQRLDTRLLAIVTGRTT